MKKFNEMMIKATATCNMISKAKPVAMWQYLNYAVELGEAKAVLRDGLEKDGKGKFDDMQADLLAALDGAYWAAYNHLEAVAERMGEMIPPVGVGEYIETPRFLTVKVAAILGAVEAREMGYNVPTDYHNEYFNVLGKSTGTNTMIFAIVRK